MRRQVLVDTPRYLTNRTNRLLLEGPPTDARSGPGDTGTMTPDPQPPPGAHRLGVRTTRRRGRASAAKTAALADLGPRWAWAPDDPAVDGRPLLVDIGVGTGTASRAWATDRPDAVVVAIELHQPGLARLLTDLEAEGPPNVRVAEDDALDLLASLPDGALAGIRVLFPDPWPKRRHVGRRLVDVPFVHRAADLLEPGGVLHVATDWPDYADQMRAVLACDARLAPQRDHVDPDDPAIWRSTRPARPVTVYEQRGIDAGRPIVDLLAIRR